MSTSVKVNEALRRVIVTVLPGPQTRTVADAVLDLTRGRPELGGWDWIIDVRNPHDLATPEELSQIAAAFNAARSKQSFTIFVSEDPATYDRCALMGTQFRDRCHLVATTLKQAEALLPRPMMSI